MSENVLAFFFWIMLLVNVDGGDCDLSRCLLFVHHHHGCFDALHFYHSTPMVRSTECTQQFLHQQDESGGAMKRCAKMCKKST